MGKIQDLKNRISEWLLDYRIRKAKKLAARISSTLTRRLERQDLTIKKLKTFLQNWSEMRTLTAKKAAHIDNLLKEVEEVTS